MSKVVLLQTSNVQFGRDFAELGDFGGQIQKAQSDAFSLMLALAKRDSINLILIVGNLFDSPFPSAEIGSFVKSQLASVKPARVFISPGLTDRYEKGCIYDDSDWPSNVHIFKSSSFEEVVLKEQGIVISGLARTDQEVANPVSSYRFHSPGSYVRVLCFCGSVIDAGLADTNPSLPFRFQELIDTGCTYAALGRHSKLHSLKKKGEQSIRGCYSGTLQGIGFEDEGEKGVLRVTLSHKKNEISFLPTARIKFHKLNLDLGNVNSEDEVFSRIYTALQEKNLKDCALKLVLSGNIGADAEVDMTRIASDIKLPDSIIHLVVEDRTACGYDPVVIAMEDSARGYFARMVLDTMYSEDVDTDESELYELALRYGLDSFNREEVKKRWL